MIKTFILNKASSNNGTLIKKIKNSKKLTDLLIKHTSFLEPTSTISQRVYHVIHDLYEVPVCLYCGARVKYKGVKYLTFCNRSCAAMYNNQNTALKLKKSRAISLNYQNKSEIEKEKIKKKRQNTLKKRYGVTHNFDINRELILCNFEEKYGTRIPSKSKKVKLKAKQTNLERYGAIAPTKNQLILEKGKATCLAKYNVEHYSKTTKFSESHKATCLAKYNVEHHMKLLKYFEKCFKYKEFKMPSGSIRKVQGYEDYVISKLLLKFEEFDIISSTREINSLIGYIDYFDKNQKHRYYPDIYIKSINTLIEVKSEYTYNRQKEKTNLKLEQARKNGFRSKLIIINKKQYDKFKNQKNL
jgi:hypothetical protein